jgi:hypothetical protein
MSGRWYPVTTTQRVLSCKYMIKHTRQPRTSGVPVREAAKGANTTPHNINPTCYKAEKSSLTCFKISHRTQGLVGTFGTF